MKPGVSVVVVPIAGGEHTRRCLETLRREAPDELLVVPGSTGDGPRQEATMVAAGTSFVPMRRLAGAHAAGCTWVAFVEDTTLVTKGWCAAARSIGAEQETGVLSGPVRLDAQLPSREMALGIVEYARYARRRSDDNKVPGNAFLVRRSLFQRPGFDHGIFEDCLADEVRAAGYRHRVDESLAVTWTGGDTGNARIGSRLAHGRLFGARRLRRATPVRRWLLRLVCPLLLASLPARGLGWTARLGYWHALPMVSVMQLCWAMGEMAGYWTGIDHAERIWH